MKKRILFINTVSGFSSTGRITADLSRMDEFDTLVCYGRKKDYENVNSYRFANLIDNCIGAFKTIVFGNSTDICRIATKRLIKKIKEYNPDIIHLHNLHGYYLNAEMLFEFLEEYKKPVVWTLHDCWALTGYCPHFDYINCAKYRTECNNCPYGFSYPFSMFKQRVKREFEIKKNLFTRINKLTVVTPSKWLESKVKESYMSNVKTVVINNGTDFSVNDENIEHKDFTAIAVANIWTKEKGVEDIKKMVPLLDENIKLRIVGNLSGKTTDFKECELIGRTGSREELINLYKTSDVFINPTLQEVFGLVNVEAQSCGIPVITYNTGGSPETISKDTGIVIEKGNYKAMAEAINSIYKDNRFNKETIKENAQHFSKERMLEEYKALYESFID